MGIRVIIRLLIPARRMSSPAVGTTWSQQAYLKASNTGAEDVFGWSVATSGNLVVVGALGEYSNATGVNGNQTDNSAAFSGAAYTFVPRYADTFCSISAMDGWVLESGENTNQGRTLDSTASTVRLGDDMLRKQYRSLLSFATFSLPDNAIITKVTLNVKRQGLVGIGDPSRYF